MPAAPGMLRSNEVPAFNAYIRRRNARTLRSLSQALYRLTMSFSACSPSATPAYRSANHRTVSVMPILMASFTIRRCNSSGMVLSKNKQIDNSARPIW
jgi:hypothetical protein